MSFARRISESPVPKFCKNPNHDPNIKDLDDGVYSWECPACGWVQMFIVHLGGWCAP